MCRDHDGYDSSTVADVQEPRSGCWSLPWLQSSTCGLLARDVRARNQSSRFEPGRSATASAGSGHPCAVANWCGRRRRVALMVGSKSDGHVLERVSVPASRVAALYL